MYTCASRVVYILDPRYIYRHTIVYYIFAFDNYYIYLWNLFLIPNTTSADIYICSRGIPCGVYIWGIAECNISKAKI